MRVKSAPGIKVPMEHNPHEYITDAKAVDLPDSAYNLRRLADGDLVEAEPVPVKSSRKTLPV